MPLSPARPMVNGLYHPCSTIPQPQYFLSVHSESGHPHFHIARRYLGIPMLANTPGHCPFISTKIHWQRNRSVTSSYNHSMGWIMETRIRRLFLCKLCIFSVPPSSPIQGVICLEIVSQLQATADLGSSRVSFP